jgi:hypothetical protein
MKTMTSSSFSSFTALLPLALLAVVALASLGTARAGLPAPWGHYHTTEEILAEFTRMAAEKPNLMRWQPVRCVQLCVVRRLCGGANATDRSGKRGRWLKRIIFLETLFGVGTFLLSLDRIHPPLSSLFSLSLSLVLITRARTRTRMHTHARPDDT